MRRRSTSTRADAAWAARPELDYNGWFELCHDEKRLKKIGGSLAPLGVEVEPLLGELSEIAMKFSGLPYWKWGPTPHEAARDIWETIAAIDAVLARFDETHNYIDPVVGWPVFPPTLATERTAREALTAMRDEVQRRADKLTAMDNNGNRNAVRVHSAYWGELAELWLAKVPDATSRPSWRKHLHRFLLACSEPMFPQQTEDKTLTAFVDDYFRKTVT